MPNTARRKETPAAAAADFLARGWSVLPVRARDKRPLIAWEALQAARPSANDLNDWFQRWPDANIGIVTGEISNLVVVDIDPMHGGDHSIERLQQRFGPLPPTVESKTGGGGRHLYFAHPGNFCRNRAGLAQGIDLRGDGGYVVAPPSVHPNGQRYAWTRGHSPADISLAPLPRWLIGAGGVRVGRSLADWRRLVREGVTEGQRNSTLASLAGHLLWHGVDAAVTLELLLAWNHARCRPPLDDAEAAQVVQNIVRLHDTDGTDRIDRRSGPDAPGIAAAERGQL
jgi:hypothetical protein